MSSQTKAVCLTFGEQSENHVKLNINGNGLAVCSSVEDLLEIKLTQIKGIESELLGLIRY